jgi:hypothetical protein
MVATLIIDRFCPFNHFSNSGFDNLKAASGVINAGAK